MDVSALQSLGATCTITTCIYHHSTHIQWYVLPPMLAIPSDPSTQQILTLVEYGVATSGTPTSNTTNTLNKSLSHQFICNIPCNETAET